MASSSKEVTQCIENNFRPLVPQTDINIAPHNWLTGQQEEVIKEACQWDISDPPEMSSISMAAQLNNKFMDADVISDTRNIKKLLRIHQSDGEVSMAVHRIRKTLLIDEFPIDHHIPQQAEKPTRKGKRRKNKNANTISKFLYHTILKNNYLTSTVSSVVARKNSFSETDIIVGMGDPLSKIVVELPQIGNSYTPSNNYNRNVYWDFEDIQMLLGNNMPIFGGGEYPAISLKLRDMKEPINVLTGIDCWLDNLICNVPELAMCWHIDGIIQSYDLYKTEDIPNIKGSKFSPLVIKDLANNVLRFLKKNCIKEGHTYWLFKAKGDDIVKLYDLSSLCNGINLNELNPFSTPVAMLCFKVAQKLFEEQRPEERNTMYTLLKNCLDLITTNTYPQIEATCHFMISDLFLSNSFGISKEKNIELKIEPLFECSYSSVPDMCSCSRLDMLDPDWEPTTSDCYWVPLATSVQQHKEKALEHIVAALQVVSHQTDSWAVKLQKLLLFKASQIFLHKSQTLKGSAVFSNALLSLITIDAYNTLLWFKETEYKHGYGYEILRCLILCHVSDCVLGELLNPNLSLPSNAVSTINNLLLSLSSLEFDKNSTKIFEWCNLIVPDLSFSARVRSSKFETKEVGLLLCLDMYLEAANYKEEIVVRKLGFVYNELGSYNLNLINLVCEDTGQEERKREEEIAKKLLKESFQHFKKAINSFLKCGDVQNIALIYSNLGKVMRASAQLQAKYYYGGAETRGPLLYEEKTFYEEAINYYNQGLDTLRKPSVQKDIWCTISNELSSVYFSMATILQDYSVVTVPEEKNETVREVTNLLNKALRIGEGLVRDGFVQARRRTGGIHHKLASLYHNEAREGDTDSSKRLKRVYNLAEVNYEKAMSYFSDKEFDLEYIQVVMEYVGLLQHLSSKPSHSLPLAVGLLCGLAKYIDTGNTDAGFVRMLLMLKKQLLSLLKQALMLNKTGVLFEGIIAQPKAGYLLALKGLQGFEDKPEQGKVMVDFLVELQGIGS